jgi:hypothetical protein
MKMTTYRCVPIATEIAERFRQTGEDDYGNPIRRMEASDGNGFPCRHCLEAGVAGDTMLLGSYNLPRPLGIYWTPSPIFVHARSCRAFTAKNEIAPTVSVNALVSVRAYDGSDQLIYDLGEVCAGDVADTPLERALADPRTEFVNIHTARPGCLLTRVERIRGDY